MIININSTLSPNTKILDFTTMNMEQGCVGSPISADFVVVRELLPSYHSQGATVISCHLIILIDVLFVSITEHGTLNNSVAVAPKMKSI
jgi:hypothetical protein